MTVQEELQQYVKKNNVSMNMVSKGIGYSQSALSLWLRGDYAGDSKAIEDDVAKFLGRQKERAKTHISGDFVPTRQAQEVISVLRYAHVHSEMGVIYGHSGMGKTTAIAQYAARESGVIVITVDPVSSSPSAILHDLAEAVGEQPKGTLRGLLRRISKKLSDTGKLIVVDEAQFLTHRAIEVLRKVHDTAKVGVVFSGMPRLYHHMIGNGVELFEQIKNRVGIKKELPDFSEEDGLLILQSFDPAISASLARMAFDMSGACARRLVKLYRHAARLAVITEQGVSQAHFLEAQKFLYEDTVKEIRQAPPVSKMPSKPVKNDMPKVQEKSVPAAAKAVA